MLHLWRAVPAQFFWSFLQNLNIKFGIQSAKGYIFLFVWTRFWAEGVRLIIETFLDGLLRFTQFLQKLCDLKYDPRRKK